MPLSAWVDAFGWPHVPTGHGEGTGTRQDYLANRADEKNEGHCTEIEKYERKKSGEWAKKERAVGVGVHRDSWLGAQIGVTSVVGSKLLEARVQRCSFPLPFGEWHFRMVRESLRVWHSPWISWWIFLFCRLSRPQWDGRKRDTKSPKNSRNEKFSTTATENVCLKDAYTVKLRKTSLT